MQLGQLVGGKYRLLRLLGDGGMGSVYEAHHEVLGARVAIKVLHEELASRPQLVDRFLREGRVLAQINNPHVVRVLDIAMAEEGRSAYIVMELLSGETLSDVLTRERRLSLPVAVDYADQILAALAATHALGVVHRDLKPENVFVTRDGPRAVLKVIDFGIAKAGGVAGAGANLTLSGALMGTPEYMAPEQAHSADRADARADVYSVGVMLYEMLAGVRPVDGDDPRLVAMKVERGEARPLIHVVPDVPRDLAGLVHRAMAPRPELRFAGAVEMRQALATVTAEKRPQPSAAPVPPSVAPMNAPASVAAAPQTTPDAVRGSGTVMVEPRPGVAPQLGSVRPAAGGTDPGDAPFVPPYAGGYANEPPRPPYGSNPSQPPAQAGGQAVHAMAPPLRGRRRGRGGVGWAIVALVALVGGGAALALGVGRSPGSSAKATPSASSSTTEIAAVDPPSSGSATPAPEDDPIGPLPAGPRKPPHAVVSPIPRGSASGAPSASAAPSVAPSNPFGVPPFSLPSGLPSLPNPFPKGDGSGVGPIITFPTAFPPFQFPGAPEAPSAPPAAPSGKPHHGH